jgi:hypothetical protein
VRKMPRSTPPEDATRFSERIIHLTAMQGVSSTMDRQKRSGE